MSYQETIDFLYSRLPVFHHIGARAFKPGLRTTIELCESLGNPQNSYPSIHIGGTNGKGSSSHMLASILQHAGYKVGLYTSPHLKSFTERIKVDGKEIDEDFVVEFVHDNLSNIDKLEPSFFELTVAMAFSYFGSCQLDVAVVEVGMGGRLDSTNIITPVLSLITNVSYDHTQFLGDTLVKIASEKAGIIKEDVPIVISEFQNDDISDVFNFRAANLNSEIFYGSSRYEARDMGIEGMKRTVNILEAGTQNTVFENLTLDLTGTYQLRNVCGVLTAADQLCRIGFNLTENSIRSGLGEVVASTGLKGRWQKLNDKPQVYCDTAHNYAGLFETIRQFVTIASSQMRFVIGFVADKDISAILELFPANGVFYFCQPSNLRALNVAELHRIATEKNLNGFRFSDVNEALTAAILDSGEEDTIYVGGSTFVVADLDHL